MESTIEVEHCKEQHSAVEKYRKLQLPFYRRELRHRTDRQTVEVRVCVPTHAPPEPPTWILVEKKCTKRRRGLDC